MLNLVTSRTLHDIHRSHHIRGDVLARLLKAVSHTRLTCQMNNHVRLKRIDRVLQLAVVFQHGIGEGEILVRNQLLLAIKLQLDVIIVGKPIKTMNPEAVFKQ